MAPLGRSRLKELQRPFLEAALRAGVRNDGRRFTDGRPISIDYSFARRGQVEVAFGATRVLGCVSGEVVPPRPDRPADGLVSFTVDLNTMASTDYDFFPSAGSYTQERAMELGVHVENLLRRSRALDTEALCVEGGSKVWSLNVYLRVLDDDGNLEDVVSLAALAALLHYRKQKTLEHTPGSPEAQAAERVAPMPLSLHHLPILVSLCWLDGGGPLLVDASKEEEIAAPTKICVAVNQFSELCGMRKIGGSPLLFHQMQSALPVANARALSVVEVLISTMKEHDKRCEMMRKNIWQRYSMPAIEISCTDDPSRTMREKSAARKKAASADVSGAGRNAVAVLRSKTERHRREMNAAASALSVEDEEGTSGQSDSDSGLEPRCQRQESVPEPRPIEFLLEPVKATQDGAAADDADMFCTAIRPKSRKQKGRQAK